MSTGTKHPRIHLAAPGAMLTACGQSAGMVQTVAHRSAATGVLCGYCLATKSERS